jgi:hypothetical protein
VPPFDYTSGDPNHLVGGQPAAMVDIRGPFGDIKTFLNSGVLDPIANLKAPLAVLSQTQVGEVGDFNQQRAGRQLTAADFTNIGLSAPAGLWNLSDLTDVSGNARTLSNKGSVPFGVGINGVASTAAAFAGSTARRHQSDRRHRHQRRGRRPLALRRRHLRRHANPALRGRRD